MPRPAYLIKRKHENQFHIHGLKKVHEKEKYKKKSNWHVDNVREKKKVCTSYCNNW
jgi:hypothetical protein